MYSTVQLLRQRVARKLDKTEETHTDKSKDSNSSCRRHNRRYRCTRNSYIGPSQRALSMRASCAILLRSLPMRCSASAMFAPSNVDSCQARTRRSIYSLRCRLDVSFNLITHSVIHSDVHVASKLNSVWIATLYNLAALR